MHADTHYDDIAGRLDRESQRHTNGHHADAAPTPLVRPIPPPAPYPIDALGPILAPAARAIAEIVQAPEALAANSVLATAALAAQPHANVQTLGGARPLSLYILTIAGSGDRKSAADKVALDPISSHVRRMTTLYQTALAEYQRASEARKFARSKAKKGAESPDDYAAALEEIAEEDKPRKPWLVCSEPTAEGLMRSLAEGQYGQGIYSDEGGQFLGGHALSEEAELRTVTMLSRAWQGEPLDRVRATDDEHVILYGRRLSMHLMVQPDVATRLLGKSLYRSQGFLARWLIAAPDSLAGTRRHDPSQPDPQDDGRIRRYWHAIGELLARPPGEDHEVGGLDPPCIALSPEARSVLVSAYDELESAQGSGADLETVREWASKAAEHACRLAGVLTLVVDPAAFSVSGETMRNALALMQHYLGEYMRLIGSAGVSEEIRSAQLLLEWIQRKGHRSITPRQVMQYGPGSIRSADGARGAIRTLAAHGWVATENDRLFTVHNDAFTEMKV
jgi:Protein of unknown function (DUF3987)